MLSEIGFVLKQKQVRKNEHLQIILYLIIEWLKPVTFRLIKLSTDFCQIFIVVTETKFTAFKF